MPKPPLTKKWGLIALALSLAITSHGLFLYYTHLMEVSFYSSHRATFENQSAGTPTLSNKSNEELAKKRNDELAAIFKESSPTIIEEAISSYHEYASNEQTATLENVPMPDIAIPAESSDLVEIDTPQALSIAQEMPSPISTPDLTTITLEEDHREELLADLIEATDRIQGLVIDEPTIELTSSSTIQAGVAENTSLNGNALLRNTLGVSEIEHDMSLSLPDYKSISEHMVRYALTASTPASTGILKLPAQNNDRKATSLPGSNTFDVTVQFDPTPNETGYPFRVTLTPKTNVHFKRITQNYYFLIDRTHSIHHQRYELTKAAVINALNYLYPGDTFNVMVFDDEVVRFAPHTVIASPDNISRAQQFIKIQRHGRAFTSTDLYTSLEQMLPTEVPEKEVNTLILLSDGDTYLSREKQKEMIAAWTAKNAGKMSLYSVPMGGGNNLPLLEMLSSLNKGYMTHASKDREATSVLQQLVQQINHPIGKDLIATPILKGNQAHISIYPSTKRLPNLYENSSYTLFGSIDRLENFNLFIQGRYYDELLDINIPIDFSKAQLVTDGSLQPQIARQKAYLFYENYLHDGYKEYLNQAKKLLKQ